MFELTFPFDGRIMTPLAPLPFLWALSVIDDAPTEIAGVL